MSDSIFREKNLKRISSPEQLDAYLKTTSSSAWLLLSAIVVLLLGLLFWAIVGKIETSKVTICVVKNNELTCYVNEETAKNINDNSIIKLDGYDQRYVIYSVDYLGKVDFEKLNVSHLTLIDKDDYIYELKAKCDLKDTNVVVDGKVVLEEISPIKFIFN